MRKELSIFIIIIFFIFLFELVGWFSFLQSIGQRISIPATQRATKLVTILSKPYTFLIFSFSKSKYMQQLEMNYAQSQAQLAEYDALKIENEELKKLLGSTDRKAGQDTIIGAPIVSLAFPAIGVGSVDGVQEKDMVLVGGILVGTVESVSEYQSKISLLTSRRSNRILARTESGAEGVIDGDGKSVLLTHIPRSTVVTEGERVVTVGQEGIEKNMLIGKVQRSQTSPSDATQTVLVSQIVSFYTAVVVEVK